MAGMIESLRISNLGVIAEASVELNPGLTVLTGETGAGKTMVLTALGLILGDRADPALIRAGTDHCSVEAIFTMPASPELIERLDDIGADTDTAGDHLDVIATRTLTVGKSRAILGGRSVPSGTLRSFTEPMVAVHGQADQWRLRRAAEQLAILDSYAGVDLAEYQAQFRAWRRLHEQLQAWHQDASQAQRAAQERADGLAAIAAVDPQPGEDADLDARAGALGHAVSIQQDAAEAQHALLGDEDDIAASDAMSAMIRALRAGERIVAVDPRAADVVGHMRGAQGAIAEAASALQHYADAIDADPAALARIEERRRAIADLKRRYGPSLDDVLSWRDAAAREADLDIGTQIAEAAERLTVLEAEVLHQASAISALRIAAAERLTAAVAEELAVLAMPGARLGVDFESGSGIEACTESGIDQITFTLASHAGGTPRPLAKGASGGELARVMLALEVVLAGTTDVPTFVFDEVDAGIGGRAAVEVGRRLAALAERAQVLVVTHLPQVAAFADTHIVVDKTTTGAVAATDVRVLDDGGRVDELVRMLSGLPDTSAGADHAREMLASAKRVARHRTSAH